MLKGKKMDEPFDVDVPLVTAVPDDVFVVPVLVVLADELVRYFFEFMVGMLVDENVPPVVRSIEPAPGKLAI